MAQEGAIFQKGETYIRVIATGHCFPYHEETARLISREEAEFVVWDGTEMLKIKVKEAVKEETPESQTFAERIASPKAVIKASDPPKMKKALGPPPAKPRVDLSVPVE